MHDAHNHCGTAQQWGGSGGNGAAMRHFLATGKRYPLVVKLGTITPHGADVYSYAPDEDDMVTDPLLGQHLSHWGINMMQASPSGFPVPVLVRQSVLATWPQAWLLSASSSSSWLVCYCPSLCATA